MPRSEKMTSLSPLNLKYAREYYGLSISEVTSRIKSIKEEELRDYEEGRNFPSYAKLELLANLYNRPLIYFFFKTIPEEEKLSVAFRSVEMQSGRKLSLQVRSMIERAELYRLNLSEMDIQTRHLSFSRCLEDDMINTGEQLIKWLRKKLDLPLSKQKNEFKRADLLLEYIRETLYDLGIYVFKDSFKADDVSGLCLYDNKYPIILLNNKTSFTRQIFTVFHEIYHLFCKETNVYYLDYDNEKACDQFASEFLIPAEDFSTYISGKKSCEDLDFIGELAKVYVVSPAAIAYRLLEDRKISRNFYLKVQEDGIRKINSATTGGNFYFTKISYMGRKYLKSVFSEYYSGKISVAEVGKYTGLKASHISRLSSNMFGGVL